MDGHYDILRRAVANIPDAGRRQALYGRARRVLADQIRTAVPPLSDAVIEAHRSALEDAIERLESELHEDAGYGPVGPLDVAAPPPSRRPALPWLVAVVAAVVVGAVALGAVLLRGSPPQPAPSKPSKAVAAADTRVEIDDRSPSAATGASAGRSYTYGRQLTYYRTTHPAGTMIIDKGQRFLYLIRPNTSAIRYGIGIGRECLDLPALMQVTRKATAQPGSKDESESLGPRRVFLDSDTRFIHGTNRPDTIGRSVWLGCVRLMNEDIIDLYENTNVGGRVVVTE